MDEAPKFEEGLAALEKLVAELEDGELGLDEALKRFEQGVKLAGHMQKSLDETGRKIEKLGAEGLRPLGDDDDDGAVDEVSAPAKETSASGAAVRKPARGKSPSAPTLF